MGRPTWNGIRPRTVQIGITSISILNGIVGRAILARPLSTWLRSLGAGRNSTEIGATALVMIVVTYLSIVLGELLPKRLGQINPEPVARIVSRPMLWLASLATSFVKLLSGSTDLCLRLLGMINAKQLLAHTIRGEQPNLTSSVHLATFVPESLSGLELFDSFRSTCTQNALVIDEYGEIQGLVT